MKTGQNKIDEWLPVLLRTPTGTSSSGLRTNTSCNSLSSSSVSMFMKPRSFSRKCTAWGRKCRLANCRADTWAGPSLYVYGMCGMRVTMNGQLAWFTRLDTNPKRQNAHARSCETTPASASPYIDACAWTLKCPLSPAVRCLSTVSF
jgi:hypothetical protein